jgi:ribosomal protein S20
MNLIKKIILAFFLIFTITVSNTTLAAGKIENATLGEIKASIDTTIERSEKTLAAIENGGDKETVLGLLSDTKQMAKEIHATRRAAVFKSKAGTQMKKARKAAKKDDLEAAKTHVEKGVEFYKQLKQAFLETNG